MDRTAASTDAPARSQGVLDSSRAVRARSEMARGVAAETRTTVAAVIRQARALRADLRRQRARGVSDRSAWPPSASAAPAPNAPERAIVPSALVAAGLSDDDLDELTDSLITAYEATAMQGDEVKHALLAWALRRVGIYLAQRVGPKAGGVAMN